MTASPRSRRTARLAAAAVGLGLTWITVVGFTRMNPSDLTIALLIVLAEVLAVAALSGPLLAVPVAFASVFLVNWYLVPPYGTFEIASRDNVVALLVFTFVAVAGSVVVEIAARARARAEESARQAELLGDVVTVAEQDDAVTALEKIRTGLGLDQVELLGPGTAGGSEILVRAGAPGSGDAVLDIGLPDGYRLRGVGPELFAPDPDFLASIGAAAVRAYESERLQQESDRADELAAIDRSRTALLASVGHDLRTPLSSLRVSIDALTDSRTTLTEVDRTALLATMDASTTRLDDLITNLLDMSRLQAGAVPIRLEPTDVEVAVSRALADADSDRIDLRLPAGLPEVAADPALLERVIANLLSNALRYSPEDRSVIIDAATTGDAVLLSIIDHGPGISPEDTEAVFTAFHRIGAQPDGGTGLGLAIVRGFADAMGMSVDLVPASGGGLEARVMMPTWEGQIR